MANPSAVGNQVYYQVWYMRPPSKLSNNLRHILVTCEDIRDAVQFIVTSYLKNPCCKGDFGIATTYSKSNNRFIGSSYRDECEG